MSKRNGKWVVVAILGLVLGVSFLTWVIQQRINDNIGQPAPASESP